MFTGIIEGVGTLLERRAHSAGHRCRFRAPGLWPDALRTGESVAVEGVCLTVQPGPGRDEFEADALDETLRLTTLGRLTPGAPVNLERALRADGRLGGHLVSGHVDGLARVAAVVNDGRDRVLRCHCAEELARGLVLKGSIAINGVSLTLTEVEPAAFAVRIIPHTWQVTTLAGLTAGCEVNIEGDLIGKYVAAYLSRLAPAQGLTLDHLRRAGFAD